MNAGNGGTAGPAGTGPAAAGAGLDAAAVAAFFTRADGSYLCARWARPIVPVAFGIDEPTRAALRDAVAAVADLAGHPVAATDPELGANLMFFFLRDWAELAGVPGLDRLIPDLWPLLGRLEAAGANQYRVFRFDPGGGIRACFAFVRLDAELAALPAAAVVLGQAVQAILLWSDLAFRDRPALARAPSGAVVLRPEVAAVIRAAYDPVLPGAATAPAHAPRLLARIRRLQ